MDISTHKWTIEEKELAEVLLNSVNKNEDRIYYSEVSARMPSHPNPHTELPTPLYHIGLLCDYLGLPFITALVVTKSGKEPGSGLRPVMIECGKDKPKLSNAELFQVERLKIHSCNRWKLLADYLDIEIDLLPKGEVIYPDELSFEEEKYIEGQPKKVTVNNYERDQLARKACIEHYSKNGRICCQICGFDFGNFYGEDYANIIEVHHIKPLAEIGKSYKVNPKKDLIPVCPNCHTVLHSKVGESLKDLQKRLIGGR